MTTHDYPLFVHWQQTLHWIMDSAERFPQKARFTLANRIVELALDVLENIIEAIYSGTRKVFLQRINLQLEKLRILFRLSCERHYISLKQLEYISRQLNEAGKMTGGWLKQQA